MNTRSFALAGLGALAMAGTTSARLVGTNIRLGPVQHPGPDVRTYRLYLVFDDPMDQLLAICGNADVSPLVFRSEGGADPSLQQNCILKNSILCDVPGPLDLGGDSWVTIGLPGDVAFTPNFLGGNGIKSAFFSQPDDGCYFDPEPDVSPVLPNENNEIAIAQFSLRTDVTGWFYRGTADYLRGGADPVSAYFCISGIGGYCCRGDIDFNQRVDFNDLLALLAAWGPCEGCQEDLNNDGTVDLDDLLVLLSRWGFCPD